MDSNAAHALVRFGFGRKGTKPIRAPGRCPSFPVGSPAPLVSSSGFFDPNPSAACGGDQDSRRPAQRLGLELPHTTVRQPGSEAAERYDPHSGNHLQPILGSKAKRLERSTLRMLLAPLPLDHQSCRNIQDARKHRLTGPLSLAQRADIPAPVTFVKRPPPTFPSGARTTFSPDASAQRRQPSCPPQAASKAAATARTQVHHRRMYRE
jgi:hypothetical protein